MDPQQRIETVSRLRFTLQRNNRLRLEFLASLSKLFRDHKIEVDDDLLAKLVLAVPEELPDHDESAYNLAKLRDSKLKDSQPPQPSATKSQPPQPSAAQSQPPQPSAVQSQPPQPSAVQSQPPQPSAVRSQPPQPSGQKPPRPSQKAPKSSKKQESKKRRGK